MTEAPVLPPGIDRPGELRAAVVVPAAGLRATAGALLQRGYRLALVAAIDSEGPMRVAYLFTSGPPDRRVELTVEVDRRRPEVPSLAAMARSP